MDHAHPGVRHFRRKRFFYRLFLRRSPRNAAVFGFCWNWLWTNLLCGFLLFGGGRLLGYGGPGEQAAAIAAGAILLVLWSYGLQVLGYAYIGMLRRSFGKRRSVILELFCGAGAIFDVIGAPILAVALWKLRRVGSALLALAAAGLIVTQFFHTKPWFPPEPRMAGLLSCWGMFLLLTALALFPDGRKLRIRGFWPLFFVFLYTGMLGNYALRLDRENRELTGEIGVLAGRPVDPESFLERDRSGFPVTSEPLKTLIATQPGEDALPSRNPAAPPSEHAAEAAKFERENPEFVAALEQFLKLEPQPVRHKDSDLIFTITMPELNAFRRASAYLAARLAASAGDRAAVLRYNADLRRLRDWYLADPSLIAFLCAHALEENRLQALAGALAAGTLTDDDLKNIRKDFVNWERESAEAIGDEATAFISVYEFVTRMPKGAESLPEHPYRRLNSLPRLPPHVGVFFRRDLRYALRHYRRILSLPAGLSGREQMQLTEPGKREILSNFHMLSGMMLPAINQVFRITAEMRTRQRLFETAAAIETFRKTYRRLPESLEELTPEFLPELPLDDVDRRTVRYEHGALESRWKFEEPRPFTGYRLSAGNNTPPGERSRRPVTFEVPDPVPVTP